MSAVDKKQKINLVATSSGWKATNIPGIGAGRGGVGKGVLGRKHKEVRDIAAARDAEKQKKKGPPPKKGKK